MHRNHLIWGLSGCLLLPVFWLVATTEINTLRTVGLLLGALGSAVLMVTLAWRAHRKGLLVANRCATCDRPMCYTQPGEMKPPPGSKVTKLRFWRCRHCGRLV